MEKILIVDDDRILSKMITNALGKYADKFELFPASDGEEAIAVLKQEPISLVVTDIQMPRINGVILLAYVHTYHPSVPCFVMTSYGTSRLRAKLPIDIIRFFQKPIDVNDLVQAIVAVFERKEPGETVQGVSMVSFLDMINMEQISCQFEIQSPGKPAGVLYFKDGILYDAECGDKDGEAAALELIARAMSTYGFKDFPEEEIARQIKTDLKDLIRNALLVQPETELPLS